MTNTTADLANFVPLKRRHLERFKIIAFTHNNLPVEELGRFHVEPENIAEKMAGLKNSLGLSELMYLSTCNRVEFIMVFDTGQSSANTSTFLRHFHPDFTDEELAYFSSKAKSWMGINAVNHLIEVASSLDSMVLGEREIISQVKDAYELASKNNLSGDMIRIIVRHTIETAKRIYSETAIAKKPVSVVSLAYHHLVSKLSDLDARVLVIGAGITNVNMCRFLKDHGFHTFYIYNRNLENAQTLARIIGGEARALKTLPDHTEGFDLIVSCTASSGHILTPEIYEKIAGQDKKKKVVVDLAVPSDLDPEITNLFKVDHISVAFLKTISDQNLKERKKELLRVRQLIYDALEEFKEIFKLRQIELQMRSIPEQVKTIRSRAVNEVFSKEIDQLDEQAKATLEKILNYMEKKYVSVPMLVAKQLVEERNTKA